MVGVVDAVDSVSVVFSVDDANICSVLSHDSANNKYIVRDAMQVLIRLIVV